MDGEREQREGCQLKPQQREKSHSRGGGGVMEFSYFKKFEKKEAARKTK